MNQLGGVSHPLYFLLLLLFCYGFFKLAACLPYLPGVAAGEHLPHRHTRFLVSVQWESPRRAGLAPSHRGRCGVSSS